MLRKWITSLCGAAHSTEAERPHLAVLESGTDAATHSQEVSCVLDPDDRISLLLTAYMRLAAADSENLRPSHSVRTLRDSLDRFVIGQRRGVGKWLTDDVHRLLGNLNDSIYAPTATEERVEALSDPAYMHELVLEAFLRANTREGGAVVARRAALRIAAEAAVKHPRSPKSCLTWLRDDSGLLDDAFNSAERVLVVQQIAQHHNMQEGSEPTTLHPATAPCLQNYVKMQVEGRIAFNEMVRVEKDGVWVPRFRDVPDELLLIAFPHSQRSPE